MDRWREREGDRELSRACEEDILEKTILGYVLNIDYLLAKKEFGSVEPSSAHRL